MKNVIGAAAAGGHLPAVVVAVPAEERARERGLGAQDRRAGAEASAGAAEGLGRLVAMAEVSAQIILRSTRARFATL